MASKSDTSDSSSSTNTTTSSNSNSVESEYDNENENEEVFVSGDEEEFEEAHDDVDEGLESLRPIARLTVDDENNDRLRLRVSESGFDGKTDEFTDSDGKNESGFVESGDGKVVGDGIHLEGEIEGVDLKVESGDSKAVEVDGVKVTSAGDSVVEDVDVDLVGPGVAVVGNVEAAEEEGIDLDRKTDGVESGDGVKVTSAGDSVVEDFNVDVMLPSRVAIVGKVEESRASGDGDDGAAVVETQGVDVNNQFGKISNDVEGSLELKSEGAEPESGNANSKVQLSEQTSGSIECVNKEDTEKICKNANDVEERLEKGGKSLVTPPDDNKFSVLADANENSTVEPPPEVKEKEPMLETHAHSPTSSVGEYKSDRGSEEKDGAATLQVIEAEQVGHLKVDVSRKSEDEDEVSEVAQQRDVKPNDEDIQNQYPEGPEFDQQRDVKPIDEDVQNQSPEGQGEAKGTGDEEEREGLVFESSEVSKQFLDIQNQHPQGQEFAQQRDVKSNDEDIQSQSPEGQGEAKGTETEDKRKAIVFESSEVAKQFLKELGQQSSFGSSSVSGDSHDHSPKIDGEIVTDSDEEADSDEDSNGKELFDSATLTALLKAATTESSDGGNVSITSQNGTRLFSVERPAGLGSSIRSLKPASQLTRPNPFTSSDLTASGDSDNNLSEEEKEKLSKLQQIRIKFLRLLHRLGYSPEDSMAGQVLYRLALLGGMKSGQLFNLESAKSTALQLESDGGDGFDFSFNVLVIGKTGTGKSATVNSIFGEERSHIHAFEAATNSVQEIVGMVDGIKIRIIDTPGLRSSAVDQNVNKKILSSVKKFTQKFPPDVVLYVDRLDTQTKDLNDLPLLRNITNSLGPSIWRNAIVTLTHAASAPPDGPSGSPLSYEVFVAQRSHIVQQSIGQAVGDLRMMNPSLMNPVSLVENHPSCRKNRDGQKVLPNGLSWRPQLLLLCYSLKILSQANSLSKAQNRVDQKKLFGFRVRSPPLPYILSWLLQSRTHPKLSTDQGTDIGDSDVDIVDLSDSEEEDEEDDYDQLPPFMPLKKAQLAKLSKEQKQAYYEEYDYRVKLLQKKQWKEELKRVRETKKRKIHGDVYNKSQEYIDQDDGAPATVPVPLPDMTLPHSFDGDNPAYRYRFLEPTSMFVARPVLDTHGWDHDCGYDGVNVEQSLAIGSQFPAALAFQLTKDKKEFNIHLDSSVATKHGENGSTMAGFDIQHVGKQLGYTVRGETKFKNLRRNKTTAGVSVTFLGENIATGLKIEDQIALGKCLVLVGSTGTVRSQGDAAYGSNLEVRLREADYPIGQNQSSLGLSLVKWKGDLALGANLQSQFSVGRSSKIAVRMGLNNKRSGQISIRTSSSDQIQIALVGIIPIAMAIYNTIRPGVSENYPLY